jgi:hypothetical protein
LLKCNLAFGQLLIDEPQLVVLQEHLEAKLILDNFPGGLQVKSLAGPALHARLLAIG